MTQLGVRPERPLYPHFYQDWAVVLNHGRFYGVPSHLDPGEAQNRGQLTTHPAILSAPSRKELEALIRDADPAWFRQEFVESWEGYHLYRCQGALHAVPQAAGTVNLDSEEECRWAGVIRGETREDVQERIRGRDTAVPVEF